MRRNNQNQAPRNPLTDQLFKKQNQENAIMKGFRFLFPQEQPSRTHIETNAYPNKLNEQTIYSSYKSPIQQRNNNQTSYKIDNKASIINGKLVLFQPQPVNVKQNSRELMKLLRQNNINFKEYMLGDQEKYQRQIEERQKKKQEALINQYINKHIKMEKTTKIQFANHTYPLKSTTSTFNVTQ